MTKNEVVLGYIDGILILIPISLGVAAYRAFKEVEREEKIRLQAKREMLNYLKTKKYAN